MEFHFITIYVHCYGTFTLQESNSETNTRFHEILLSVVTVTVNTFIEFHTGHILLGLSVRLGLGQCEHIVTSVLAFPSVAMERNIY